MTFYPETIYFDSALVTATATICTLVASATATICSSNNGNNLHFSCSNYVNNLHFNCSSNVNNFHFSCSNGNCIKQIVRVNGKLSNPEPVINGIPQGSVKENIMPWIN